MKLGMGTARNEAAWLTLGLVVLALAWDAAGLDMPLARLAGSAAGFPWRDHWLPSALLHDGARRLSWVLALGLCLSVWWPLGVLKQLPQGRRLQLASTTLLAALVVSLLKVSSRTSCPWELSDFGGLAHYASHWTLRSDGGTGRCFPAGHAASGFSFVGVYFAVRRFDAAAARRWLATALGIGLVLGLAQQWRGAHFMSHTLWTAAICWCVAIAVDSGWPRGAQPGGPEMRPSHSRAIAPATLLAAATLWIALAGNAPLWRQLQVRGLLEAKSGWLLAGSLAGMLAAGLFALLSLLAWRPVLKPVLVLLLFSSALAAHFMWTYGIVIDGSMAANTLQTDWHEARALLSPRLFVVLLLAAALPSWLVWQLPIVRRPWKRQALRNAIGALGGLVVLGGLLLLSFQPLASAMRNHKDLRYLMTPFNTLYAAGQAAFGGERTRGPLVPLGLDARVAPPLAGSKPRLLLVVLGETGRSGNFGINGYARETTPELARAEVATFRNTWSCGTSTAASVPCMFSNLGRAGFSARKRDSENLLDVLQHAGLAVLWIDNQAGGCKGVCARVPTVNTSGAADPRFCAGGECHDEILLAGLDARIAGLPEARRRLGVVVVLHQMGSHGPGYAERTPPAFKRFLPECTSSHLPDCSREELRNAYDNTIAYTDHVLGSAIDWLRQRADYDGALLYVADHGESLGENNLYLHGLPYALAPDVQKHVPWITWLSPSFQQRTGVTLSCLRRQAYLRVTHDHLFHSVLGLMQVATSAYRLPLDAYGACGPH